MLNMIVSIDGAYRRKKDKRIDGYVLSAIRGLYFVGFYRTRVVTRVNPSLVLRDGFFCLKKLKYSVSIERNY